MNIPGLTVHNLLVHVIPKKNVYLWCDVSKPSYISAVCVMLRPIQFQTGVKGRFTRCGNLLHHSEVNVNGTLLMIFIFHVGKQA